MDIAHQGLLHVKGAVEAVGFQHVADARRNQMSDAYAKLRQEAKARQSEAGGDRKSETYTGSLEQLVAQPMPDERGPQTRDLRAKAAGTNARYIDLADKIVAERPEMAALIEAGKMTLSQAWPGSGR